MAIYAATPPASVVRTTELYTEGGDALDLARREEREYREYLSDE